MRDWIESSIGTRSGSAPAGVSPAPAGDVAIPVPLRSRTRRCQNPTRESSDERLRISRMRVDASPDCPPSRSVATCAAILLSSSTCGSGGRSSPSAPGTAASARSIASLISRAEPKRSSALFRRARSMTAFTGPGISYGVGRGGSMITRSMMFGSESPGLSNGRVQVRSSYRTTPTDQRSARWSTLEASRSCSGEQYRTVPIIPLVVVSPPLPLSILASPKSVTLGTPFWNRTLPGLMSRWRMGGSFSWAATSASQI